MDHLLLGFTRDLALNILLSAFPEKPPYGISPLKQVQLSSVHR